VLKLTKVYVHRTCLTPRASRNGSIKSSMDVNCEKIIVFSTLSERSSIVSKISKIFLILADSGGRFDFSVDSVVLARDRHSLQCVASSPAARLW